MTSQKPHVIKVEEMMTCNVVCTFKENTMNNVKELMRTYSITGIPVVNENNVLLGVVSIADVIRAMENNQVNEPVENFMTKDVSFLYPWQSVGKAVETFRKYKFGRLPIINQNNKVVGIITQSDIINRLANILNIGEIDEDYKDKVDNVEKNPEVITYNIDSNNFANAGLAASSLKKYLQALNIDSEIIRRVAIATYEAEMNIVIHALNGKITAFIEDNFIKIIAEDYGPGIEDVNKAMIPGFSTASDMIRQMGFGAGMGLPNIKRSSDNFLIESEMGKGTRLEILIKKGA